MRTHPVDKLLEQHCYKSAAGLLQLVRFYVCSPDDQSFGGLGRLLSLELMLTLRPRLHYTGLHRSVAIFIPDLAAVYTTPQ